MGRGGPGAKKNILESLPEPKRAQLNTLVAELGRYLHAGRHVAAFGEEKGAFPVDHQDAAFALNLMRILLAHLSQTVASTRPRC